MKKIKNKNNSTNLYNNINDYKKFDKYIDISKKYTKKETI